MADQLEEFKEERDDLIFELNSIKDGIDLDYFDLTLDEKYDLNKLLDTQITFLKNTGNKIYELKEGLSNNKLNKAEKEKLENKANKLLLFFIEELSERQQVLEKEINRFLTK